MKLYLALFSSLFVFYCSSLGQKDNLTDPEFELSLKNGKWIRTDRFKNSGEIRGKGEVKAECGGSICTEEQVSKFAPPKIKSLPKQGIWEEYVQFEEEGSTSEKPKFKSSLDQVGEYIDGKRTGVWRKPDPENPKLTLAETPWVDGKKEGVAKTFNKQGILISETNYVNDLKEGSYFRKTSKGEWVEKGSYQNNEETGEWTFYFTGSDGNGIKNVVTFRNGEKEGNEVNYYKDGKIESLGSYNKGIRTGLWKLFSPKGTLAAEGTYTAKDNAENQDIKYERSGIWKEYYPNGSLFATGLRKHTRVGEWKFYYNNGQIAYQGVMANESMLGSAKIFDKSGIPLGDGKLFFSLVKMDEETQDLKLNYKPSIPFTYFYPSGKKKLVIQSEEAAIEYLEDGKELGRGPVNAQGKKMGCWNLSGKVEYYMIDKPMPRMTPTQCK